MSLLSLPFVRSELNEMNAVHPLTVNDVLLVSKHLKNNSDIKELHLSSE